MTGLRIGHGYDVHRLVSDRKLILGGVQIKHEFGLLGHSDADVLVHAIIDSLFGAMSLGDIGTHFPDYDEQYKDISSIILLKNVCEILKENCYEIVNIDATILAQSPKLSPYILSMRKNIADALKIETDKINVKATTEEELGFTGKKEGIACHCVSLIEK